MTPVAPAGPAPTAAPVAAEPTHGCARCGRPVPMDVGLCEICNPLGLKDVAASQVHATVIIAVLVGFVLLAVLASLVLRGAGPYPATVGDVVPAGAGLRVTLSVTNEGSAEGQTSCRLYDAADRAGRLSAFVLSPRLRAGETRTFEATIVEFGATVRDLVAECRTP